MKRAVAVSVANMEAVNAAQASVIQERNERRGTVLPGPVGLAAPGAGFAAGGGAGFAAGAGFTDSSLLMESPVVITCRKKLLN